MLEEAFPIRPFTLADKDLAMGLFDQVGPATLQFFNMACHMAQGTVLRVDVEPSCCYN